MFIHLDKIHEYNGQTDTVRRHRLRLCIASRGKNDWGCCQFCYLDPLLFTDLWHMTTHRL